MNNNVNIFGTFNVTTEGDCEGRTTRHLGSYTGYIDEIALFLAKDAEYALTFKQTESPEKYIPTKPKVHVVLTNHNVKSDSALNKIKDAFKDRPITIKESDFYAAFSIHTDNFDEEKTAKAKALGKLTAEEKKLLGL